MIERGSGGTSERDQLSEIIFIFLGFTFTTGAHSISKEVLGFSPLWFPQGKYLCRDVFLSPIIYHTNGIVTIVDVFVTLECIHLYILCIVPRCLFRDVFVM